jgi:hypothetical protein
VTLPSVPRVSSHKKHEVLATKSTKISKKIPFVFLVSFVAESFVTFVAGDERGVEG